MSGLPLTTYFLSDAIAPIPGMMENARRRTPSSIQAWRLRPPEWRSPRAGAVEKMNPSFRWCIKLYASVRLLDRSTSLEGRDSSETDGLKPLEKHSESKLGYHPACARAI